MDLSDKIAGIVDRIGDRPTPSRVQRAMADLQALAEKAETETERMQAVAEMESLHMLAEAVARQRR